jgi:hypothetical protein
VLGTPSRLDVQELHDQIQDLLQDRDPKAQLDAQSSLTVQASGAPSLHVDSEQAPTATSPENGGEEEEQAAEVPLAVSAATTPEEDDNPGGDEPVASDSNIAGPVAEGDIAVEHVPDVDTSAAVQNKPSLHDNVVDDYIKVQSPMHSREFCCLT